MVPPDSNSRKKRKSADTTLGGRSTDGEDQNEIYLRELIRKPARRGSRDISEQSIKLLTAFQQLPESERDLTNFPEGLSPAANDLLNEVVMLNLPLIYKKAGTHLGDAGKDMQRRIEFVQHYVPDMKRQAATFDVNHPSKSGLAGWMLQRRRKAVHRFKNENLRTFSLSDGDNTKLVLLIEARKLLALRMPNAPEDPEIMATLMTEVATESMLRRRAETRVKTETGSSRPEPELVEAALTRLRTKLAEAPAGERAVTLKECIHTAKDYRNLVRTLGDLESASLNDVVQGGKGGPGEEKGARLGGIDDQNFQRVFEARRPEAMQRVIDGLPHAYRLFYAMVENDGSGAYIPKEATAGAMGVSANTVGTYVTAVRNVLGHGSTFEGPNKSPAAVDRSKMLGFGSVISVRKFGQADAGVATALPPHGKPFGHGAEPWTAAAENAAERIRQRADEAAGRDRAAEVQPTPPAPSPRRPAR